MSLFDSDSVQMQHLFIILVVYELALHKPFLLIELMLIIVYIRGTYGTMHVLQCLLYQMLGQSCGS